MLTFGGVSERPKVLASKASVGKTTEGSNPSATARRKPQVLSTWGFLLFTLCLHSSGVVVSQGEGGRYRSKPVEIRWDRAQMWHETGMSRPEYRLDTLRYLLRLSVVAKWFFATWAFAKPFRNYRQSLTGPTD